jgi:hypothetical protein
MEEQQISRDMVLRRGIVAKSSAHNLYTQQLQRRGLAHGTHAHNLDSIVRLHPPYRTDDNIFEDVTA